MKKGLFLLFPALLFSLLFVSCKHTPPDSDPEIRTSVKVSAEELGLIPERIRIAKDACVLSRIKGNCVEVDAFRAGSATITVETATRAKYSPLKKERSGGFLRFLCFFRV